MSKSVFQTTQLFPVHLKNRYLCLMIFNNKSKCLKLVIIFFSLVFATKQI